MRPRSTSRAKDPSKDPAGVRATRPLPTSRTEAEQEDDLLDRGLGDLVDEDRREQARAALRERDFRRTIERDTATMAGILRDLAEQRLSVVLDHVGGRVVGRIVSLAEDHIAIRTTRGDETVLVARWAISTVQSEPGTAPPDSVGQRDVGVELSLRDVLADAAEEQPEVALLLQGRDGLLVGILRAVGEDVLTIHTSPKVDGRTFVALHNLIRADIRH